MQDGVHSGTGSLVSASDLARTLSLRFAANGVRYACFGELQLPDVDLDRIVEAVPLSIAPALADRAFYFVPLALAEQRGDLSRASRKDSSDSSGADHDAGGGETMIAPIFTAALSDEAICHRNVSLPATPATPAHEGVFISARLLQDKFSLAFEFFINVGHAFSDSQGVPEPFQTMAWAQALADVRGETSQDASECRAEALAGRSGEEKNKVDENSKKEFLESAFADALAIYQLSLAVDFDYSELREREYPLLAPPALAERLRLVARLFPPNPGYEFSIRYRRRS